jgi:hypothetical protein
MHGHRSIHPRPAVSAIQPDEKIYGTAQASRPTGEAGDKEGLQPFNRSRVRSPISAPTIFIVTRSHYG